MVVAALQTARTVSAAPAPTSEARMSPTAIVVVRSMTVLSSCPVPQPVAAAETPQHSVPEPPRDDIATPRAGRRWNQVVSPRVSFLPGLRSSCVKAAEVPAPLGKGTVGPVANKVGGRAVTRLARRLAAW